MRALPHSHRRLLPTVLALGLLGGTLEAIAAEAPKSVVDCYRQIPERLFPYSVKYELTRTSDGWSTRNPDTDEELVPTVDTRNGFIEVVTEGGDGTLTAQAALFLRADNSPLVALSTWSLDGSPAERGRLSLLARDGGQWKAITRSALPALRLTDFIEASCLAALPEGSRKVLEEDGIVFTLPRQGTTLRASVTLTEAVLGGEEAPAAARAACPLGKHSRALKWDRKAGRFSLEPAKAAGKK